LYKGSINLVKSFITTRFHLRLNAFDVGIPNGTKTLVIVELARPFRISPFIHTGTKEFIVAAFMMH
jgi:hypothetical protein